jgi:5'-nucleotidase
MPAPHILLTNDDGINSPGLWAAAAALSELGYVHVVAPRQQYSAAGRSMPANSDGRIQTQTLSVRGKDWTVYAVGGSPAQTVLHAILEIMPVKPDLVVSGINYGENVGTAVTISGTVGAALEGAAFGVPALAVSLETDPRHHYSNSDEVDFSAAAHFTHLFARLLLEKAMPPDMDVLKVDLPAGATPETPWEINRLSRARYYEPVRPKRRQWDEPAGVGYQRVVDPQDAPGTDAYTVRVARRVSVTPLSMDMTSRLDLGQLERLLRQG